jgi:hypothetical protein
MNIYIDVDGVLILPDGTLAPYAEAFLTCLIAIPNCHLFWLSAYDRPNTMNKATVLYPLLSKDLVIKLHNIQQAIWRHHKTDAINMRQRFLWYDDELFEEERSVLRHHGVLSSFRRITLQKDTYQLLEEVGYLQMFKG